MIRFYPKTKRYHLVTRGHFWKRTGKSDDYNYTVVEKAKGDWIYDTTLPEFGNQGQYFEDEFLENERKAVIEYLKTL